VQIYNLLQKSILCIALTVLTLSASAQKVDLVGHQGAKGIMPENTIAGMLKALDLGVTTLDLDVVISKDKQVLLSHEPYFNNEISLKPNGKDISFKEEKNYNLYQMDYEEIKKFDVGSKVHKRFPGQAKYKAYKPLLSEVIDSVEAYVKLNKLDKPVYSIETVLIKKGDSIYQPLPDEFVELVMEIVKRKKLQKRTIIQSFDVRSLQYLHKKYAKIKTSLLIDEKDNFEDNISELGFNPTIYSPYHVLVGKSLVDRCHALGIKIIPWTINSEKQMRYYINLGVDGLITDYPNVYSRIKE
jgi:glycerophosphoryl diester phosphodiesterase